MGSEQTENDLIPRIGRWATRVWALESVALAFVSWRHAVGAVLGGGLSLALFFLYRRLAPALLQAGSRRRALVMFWLVWTIKLPVVGLVLYFALSRGVASPLGLILGIGLIPGLATFFAVRSLFTTRGCMTSPEGTSTQ